MKLQPFKKAIVSILIIGITSFPSMNVEAAISPNAIVVASSLNVRSKPEVQSSIVGSLKQNTVVVTSEQKYGWIKIKAGSTTGWVAGQYLQMLTAEKSDKPVLTSSNNKETTVTRSSTVLADSLHMRKGPGTQHDIVSILSSGASLAVLDSKEDWVQVRTTKGETGWVLGKYVGAQNNDSVSTSSTSKGLKGKVIVVDPGHGGSDTGTQGKKYGSNEKTLNLSTSQYLVNQLRQAGAQVTLTRSSDKENPNLSARVAISEQKRADAFVSIHYNSSPKANSGTLTFFYSNSKDMPLARKIESQLNRSLGLKSNGISYGNYHVLRENARPSVLVELGFLSNAKDEALVRSDSYQIKAAEAIVNGLRDYFSG
ncbi:N-acetylmuramoyl-L-alanine amidase [Paenibacillus sp. UNC451MF]|uniref:N-acetylmuramoyl-L-alanine amidase n=1 Tax=Paenibacillus sp. UNC451MF TaxID=1449063 RepID=UPI000491DCE4|nr:N-acetylmuramoyl-L-alanine amidase [Paenibacillus sp. UNC451MF]